MEFAAKKTKDHTGLGYLSHMVPFFLHNGDPLSFFKIDEYSKRVREEFKKGGLFEGLIKKYLIDNNHKLRIISTPDVNLASREESREKRKLEMLQNALSKEEKDSIVQEAYALK
jgi:Zn-dependent M16 (insulinase) family peptidase